MKNTIWHVLGCLLPIVAIFLLPLFGVSSGVVLLLFIVLMFGCHLIMIGGHGAMHGDHDHTRTNGEHHVHSQR